MLSDKGTVIADPAKGTERAYTLGSVGHGAKVMLQPVAVVRAGSGRNAMGVRWVRPCGFRLALARSVLAAALASLLPLYSAAAQVTAVDTAYDFDLPAGELVAALDAFGTQSGIQPHYPPGLVAGRQARAVSGRMGWRDVLGQLLQGSGLEYGQVDDTTVVIRSADGRAGAEDGSVATRLAGSPPQMESEATELEALTVTGTRIRGGTTPSPVITIGSENIREEGFADLGEVIRSVPQNFTGGQNPGVAAGATLGSGGLSNQNLTGGSSLNLRGLGPDASLTLLNGRRMSYGGYVQAVDIGAIPVEAVERVEIVPDGASAIYGSDAVGGVGNVILKRDFDGVALGARHAGATDGGLTTREYSITTGAAWTGGGLITTYKDVSTDPIYADQRWYTGHILAPTTIYPGSDLKSGLVSLHQSLGEVAEVRLDALATKRNQDYSYYYETTSDSYNRLVPESRATLVSPGIEFFLPGNWTLSVGGTRGRDDLDNLNLGVAIATEDVVPRIHECLCNEHLSYEVGAEGPLAALPAGDVRLATGVGYRRNAFRHVNHLAGTAVIDAEEASRFAYAEASLPLVGPNPARLGVRRLELTAAVRNENYDSFGSVTTPKLGLIYGPSADFTFKATWGRSFKAPTLYQLHASRLAQLVPAAYVGGTDYHPSATVLIQGGGNRGLEAERARTLTASLAFHPESLPGLQAELTWFRIAYTDRVVQPITNVVRALADPNYAPFIEYSPTEAQLDEVLATVENFFNSTGASYDPGNVAAIVWFGYTNVAEQQIDGFDLSGSYGADVRIGRVSVRGSVSWLNSTQTTSPVEPAFDVAGTLFNPAKLNGRLGVAWSRGDLSLSMFGNYTSGVTNIADDRKTGSFTTFDTTLRYAPDRSHGLLSGVELSLSAQNLFDRHPPLHAPTSWIHVPYDSTNYSAVGRFLGVSISKHF